MPCFPTETWLILKCQFAYNIEHFPIVDFFFYQLHCSYLSNLLCEGENELLSAFK